MNKKTAHLVLPALVALSLVVFAPSVFAQTDETRKAGLTPDNPIYFVDTWSEDIGLALTRGTEAKARKQYDISQEKLAEVEAMAEKKDAAATEKAATRYTSMVDGAAKTLADAAKAGEDIDSALSELVSTATAKSTEVLLGVLEKVPEQAKEAIQKAIQASSKGSQKALEAVGTDKREATQQKVQESLQKAREKAPEEAKQYIPETIPTQPEAGQGGANTAPTSAPTGTGTGVAPSLPAQAGQRGR
jgi:hypothetical protein